MGILVENNDERNKLQKRITADLRQRAQSTSRQQDVDLEDDSAYVEGTHETKRFSWFWFILIALAALSLVVIFVIK